MAICLKSKSRCERDRYNQAFNEKRKDYPLVTYNYERWKNVSPAEKISQCQELGIKVSELRLLKAGKIEDAMLSDGHRVDERGKQVYTDLYNEYNRVYGSRYCDPVLQTATANKDAIETKRQADILQDRIEKDTEKQRTIIIIVGGAVLLLGTVIILKRL